MKVIRNLFSHFSLMVISSLVLPLFTITHANSQYPFNLLNSNASQSINGNNLNFLPFISKNLGLSHYVSVYGSDNNPGTLSSPWRTISKAAGMVEPGDTVFIRGGVYQEAVEFSSSGTSSAPITILAYHGEIPVIDGNNYDLPHNDGGALLEISGNYVYVSGLEIRYSSYLGVLVGGAHDVATRINSHHNLHSGMRLAGDYSIIEYSQVWMNDMQNYNGQYPRGDSTALTASRRPDHAIIRHNVVHENWGIGLSTYEANGTIIEDNIVYDNYGPNVYISDATNILFQRNFVYATGNMIGGGQVGIQLGDETLYPPSSSSDIIIINNIVYHTKRNLAAWRGSSGKMVNVLIANNTFVNSAEESGLLFKDDLSFDNVRFMNNLIQQDGALPIISVSDYHPGLDFSNNLWSKTPQQSASGSGDFIGDPLLSHSGDIFAPEWYKLSSLSPAIDIGNPITIVTIDYFNNIRGVPPDIGANEFSP